MLARSSPASASRLSLRSRLEPVDLIGRIRADRARRPEEDVLERAARHIEPAVRPPAESVRPPQTLVLDERPELLVLAEREDRGVLGVGDVDGGVLVGAEAVAVWLGYVILDDVG